MMGFALSRCFHDRVARVNWAVKLSSAQFSSLLAAGNGA
jgi:hypothetical protein